MTAPFTPQMLVPSAPGQLSNKRGSNTGADALVIKSRYANPKGAGQALSNMRIIAKRTAQSGNPISPQQAWDSGWIGRTPAVQPLPAGKHACGGNATVQYGGRTYFMASDGTMHSAPTQGPAVGQWRIEQPMPRKSPTVAPLVYSIALVASRIYAIATVTGGTADVTALYMTTINGDGTLSAWGPAPASGSVNPNNLGALGFGLVGGWDGTSATGWLIGWNSNTAAPTVTFTIVIADGSVSLMTYPSASGPGNSNGWNITFLHQVDNWTTGFVAKTASPNTWHFFLIGTASYAGAATAACVQSVQIDPSTGLPIGAAYVARPNLPAARSLPAVVALQDGTIYVIGGSSTLIASGGTNTVYINTAAGLIAATGWTTSAQVIPTALWEAGLGIASQDLDTPTETANLNPSLIVIGGQTTGAAEIATVNAAQIINSGAPHDLRAWLSGNGVAALGGDFGTGGGITNNSDGTQDLTVVYGAAGALNFIATGSVSIAGFTDGDQVTISITHVGTDGDYSPTTTTVVKIGQAPTVSGITATPVGCARPLFAFSYNPGAGGDLEFSYQIKITDASSNLLFDSGVRYDGANSVQGLFAPSLKNQAYTCTVSVVSKDTPVSGSSNSGSGTLGFTPTPTNTGIPSGSNIATTDDSVTRTGAIYLGWVNNAPAGVTPGNRVYYRRQAPSDPGFEIAGPVGLGNADWISNNVGTGVASLDGANGRSGVYALKLTNPSAGNYGGAFNKKGYPVLPGQKLLLSGYAKGSIAGSTGVLRITFSRDGSSMVNGKTGIASAQPSADTTFSVSFDLSPNVTTGYGLFIMTVTVPTGLAYKWAHIEIYANGTTVPIVWWDDLGIFPWTLLYDFQGPVTSTFAQDQIALGVFYDFAFASTDNSAGQQSESGSVTSSASGYAGDPGNPIVSGKTDPLAGGYTGYLHVAGQGMTHGVALLVQNSPEVKTKLDMRTSLPFQQLAPVARFGVAHYQEFVLRVFIPDLIHLQELQDVINVAYQGNALYYRDGFGTLIACAPASDHAIVYKSPLYREAEIHLVQIPNQFSPSVVQGSALGYHQQLLGSVVPLSSDELIL